jgi:predicted nucleic acid-binding protein
MYLLDTSVVTASRKLATGRIDQNVRTWLNSIEKGLSYVSAITLFELEHGILLVARRDAAQAARLKRWLIESVLPAFESRILAMSDQVALQCARLNGSESSSDRDRWIAATALVHNFTVVTRNVADFERAGVALINPWLAAATS